MGSRRHLINISTSSQSSLLFRRRLSAPPISLRPIASPRKYSGETNVGREEERAPSTLEEFKRISEEKAEMEKVVEAKERQGFASQTIEKAQDGASAAAKDHSPNVEFVKEQYKEPVGKGNFHKSGDELPQDQPKPAMNFNRTEDDR